MTVSMIIPPRPRGASSCSKTVQSSPEAVAEYRKAPDLDSRHLPARLSLAWLLTTCPEASSREGRRAVEQAEQARALARSSDSPQLLDTPATAYAEGGRFPEAVETARRALDLPAIQNNRSLAEAIQSRLKLYEANAPYHEKP
jgi:tetratricopeptide (TPR) repeat protein